MSRFQLWSRDEYGQGSILMTSEDINEVVKRAKSEVTELNVNNALTATDRENNWEGYYLIVTGNDENSYFYGGTQGLDHVYFSLNKETKQVGKVKLSDIPEVSIQAYLGNISTNRSQEKDWFGLDARRRPIDRADHPDLATKTKYFIQAI
jgi:hypothetical protein